MDLSIVIPTYRRPQILKKCLDHIEQQTIANQIEVIVVSDGEDMETATVVRNANLPIPAQYFSVKKSQQGTARNRGVLEAKSPLILFIGDDIFLEPDACAIHLQSQNRQTDNAVLGFVTWDPSVGITPVMRWLERSGWQFGYPHIAQYANDAVPSALQHRFTYTSHISLPTEIARAHPFREDLMMYGWEDMEWGARLRNAGIRLMYMPQARALHHHHLSMNDSLRRMHTLGKSAKYLERKLNEFDRIPRGMKLRLQTLQALLPTMAGKHRRAFLQGLANDE